MAENVNTQQGEKQQQPQQQVRPCPRDCRKCSMAQQICCASMLSFQSFDVMNSIIQRLDAQTKVIIDLNSRIAVLEGTDLSAPSPFRDDAPCEKKEEK